MKETTVPLCCTATGAGLRSRNGLIPRHCSHVQSGLGRNRFYCKRKGKSAPARGICPVRRPEHAVSESKRFKQTRVTRCKEQLCCLKALSIPRSENNHEHTMNKPYTNPKHIRGNRNTRPGRGVHVLPRRRPRSSGSASRSARSPRASRRSPRAHGEDGGRSTYRTASWRGGFVKNGVHKRQRISRNLEFFDSNCLNVIMFRMSICKVHAK